MTDNLGSHRNNVLGMDRECTCPDETAVPVVTRSKIGGVYKGMAVGNVQARSKDQEILEEEGGPGPPS